MVQRDDDRRGSLKAALFDGKGGVRVGSVPKPNLNEHEVLIRTKAAGICGSDLHIFTGNWARGGPTGSLVLGHELSGVVEDVGERVEGIKVGSLVTIEPNILCGKCFYCRTSERNHLCENRKVVGFSPGYGGGFAEYCKAPARNVYDIPDGLDPEAAALAEPVGCAIRGIDNCGLHSGEKVVVIGAGPMGLIFVQLLHAQGASEIVVADILDHRLQRAEEFGATHTVNTRTEKLRDVVNSRTSGRGADLVIDAVGDPLVVEEAIRLARRGGRVSIFGVSTEDGEARIRPYEIYWKELQITSAFTCPFTIQRAIDLLASGVLNWKRLITHHFKLDEIVQAFDTAMKDPSRVKVIVRQ
jgi:L-iditol 2-dehydrogenase